MQGVSAEFKLISSEHERRNLLPWARIHLAQGVH